MNRDSLNTYNDNDKESPIKTTKSPGTIVFFNQLVPLTKEEIIDSIKKEFFWFLELNKNNNYSIFVDDTEIDYTEFILEKSQIDTPQLELSHVFDISFVVVVNKKVPKMSEKIPHLFYFYYWGN